MRDARIAMIAGASVAVAALAEIHCDISVAEPVVHDPHHRRPVSRRTGKSYKNVYGRKPRRMREAEAQQ